MIMKKKKTEKKVLSRIEFYSFFINKMKLCKCLNKGSCNLID